KDEASHAKPQLAAQARRGTQQTELWMHIVRLGHGRLLRASPVPSARCRGLNPRNAEPFRIEPPESRCRARAVPDAARVATHGARDWARIGACRNRRVRSALLLHRRGDCASMRPLREGEHGGGSVMELRTASPRKYAQPRMLNHCAQCGETIFLPEWSEYLDRHRVRHLWECEACGYKFETLVTFPD